MVEILIASGILGIVMITVINVYHSLAALSLQNTEKIQSAFLLEEGVEAVRVMRDAGWAANIVSLTVDQPYYLRFQDSTWTATTAPQIIDGFDRTVTFSNVMRDADFNVVSSGGTVADASSRKATVSISWATRLGTSTGSVDTYISNSFGN